MKNAALKWGRIITVSLFLGIVSEFFNKIQAQTNILDIQAIAIPSTVNTTINNVQSRLQGQWAVKDAAGEIRLIWIFTPENKIIVLIPSENGFSGYEFGGYEIVSNTQPMQLMVSNVADTDSQVTMIFELTSGLRIDFPQEKPFRFTSASLNFQKISEATTLPQNARLTNPSEFKSQQNRGREIEGRVNIGFLLNYQRSHYRETSQFSSNIQQLSSGTISAETTNYRYQILPESDHTQSVITAQAKRSDLRSYAGVVLIIGDVTITVACETDEPSSTPPVLPVTPKNGVNELKCPIGSHLVGQ